FQLDLPRVATPCRKPYPMAAAPFQCSDDSPGTTASIKYSLETSAASGPRARGTLNSQHPYSRECWDQNTRSQPAGALSPTQSKCPYGNFPGPVRGIRHC